VRCLISTAVKGSRLFGGAVGVTACCVAEECSGTFITGSAAVAGKDSGAGVAEIPHGTADTDGCASLKVGVSADAVSVETMDVLF